MHWQDRFRGLRCRGAGANIHLLLICASLLKPRGSGLTLNLVSGCVTTKPTSDSSASFAYSEKHSSVIPTAELPGIKP